MAEYKALGVEERQSMVDNRRRALESELFLHTINRIGAEDTSTFDERIAQIEAALEELDRLDPAAPAE